MQGTKRGVAGDEILDDDAKAVDVEHFRERNLLFRHFFVDGRQKLLAAGDGGLDIEFFQSRFDRIENFPHHFAAIATRLFDGFFEH